MGWAITRVLSISGDKAAGVKQYRVEAKLRSPAIGALWANMPLCAAENETKRGMNILLFGKEFNIFIVNKH